MQIQQKQNKIYFILLMACLAGYIWIALSLNHSSPNSSVCLLKNVTGVPCPSCGSTRSVLSIIHGSPLEALYWNPLGFIVASILIITPLWIVFDIRTRRNSLSHFYAKAEAFFQRKSVYVPALLLLTLNWIWNITKGL